MFGLTMLPTAPPIVPPGLRHQYISPHVLQLRNIPQGHNQGVREESGRIVIEPAQRKEYDLTELVKGITRENLHDEADFGKPVGKEAL